MTDQQPRTFADSVVAYAQAGWPCILPVPPADKFPPPTGYTGADGRDTDPLQLVTWAGSHPAHSIALRMPDGVIGIDVDQYLKADVQKHGAETLALLEAKWGALPATWSSTARGSAAGPGESRILLFRVPPQRYAANLKAERTAGPETGSVIGDIEIIQRHHRYAVVWPSPHSAVGSTYRWYSPAGLPSDRVPSPTELAELPAAWITGLADGATMQAPASADRASGEGLLAQLLEDFRPECNEITSARGLVASELAKADAGSRHDTMTARVHHLVQLAASGHTGVAAAIEEARTLWEVLTAGEDRAKEFDDSLLSSARKAVTLVGVAQVPRDPCVFMDAFGGTLASWPAPAAGDPSVPDPDAPDLDNHIADPPRWVSLREVIGVHSFDPNAGLDQPLAERVLERMFPALRYAYDANGWLLRMPTRWELHGRMSPWAVAQVATLMPVGDPTAEKGSEPHERSARRARLMSTAGARAIAGKMDDLVSGGMHPVALALSELDADPEVLWAGGLPWSLRASREALAVATHVDPTMPHLHSAAVAPERCPTPLWDAFLAAVWPDPELRAWAVRVLSITLTGYADRALPILLGETGRGKTQVISLLMSVLDSYGHAANPKLLAAGTNEHDTIVFALKGRRLSFIDEAPGEGRAGQERLKQLTGGGELTGRQMNQDPITFRPTHTFVLTANDPPLLTDGAVRSRARLIPCEGDPEQVRRTRAAIGHVSSKAWRAEAPGVLASMIAEAAAWLDDPTTAAITAAPENVRYLGEHIGSEQDPVMVWLAEETEPFEAGTSSRELYQAFTASCLRNNLRRDQIPSETRWGRDLSRLGYEPRHTEHGKRRPLRIRSGDFMPGIPTPPSFGTVQPLPPVSPDFLTGSDGLLTGSNANPSGAKQQVNPSESLFPDGSDGLGEQIRPSHTHAPAQGAPTWKTPQPVSPDSETQGLTCENVDSALPFEPISPASQADEPAQKPRKRTPPDPAKAAAAKAKRDAAAAEKRAAAIAEASGPLVQLPAVVTRDRVIRTGTPAEVDALLASITSGDGALSVDVENTGYPIGHADYALRSVQLGDETFAVDLDPHDLEQRVVIAKHLAAAKVLHAHSATADLIPLAHAGLADEDELWAKVVDTAILAKLADPSSTDNNADLKNLSRSVLGAAALSPAADQGRKELFKAGKWLTDTEVTTPIERSGWAQVDPRSSTMVLYATSDVLDCSAIARRLPMPTAEVLHRERTAQRMTARMASTGFRFDAEQVERLADEHTSARTEYAEQVRAFGIDNPGSNDQVGAAFGRLGKALPPTDTGKPSVAAAVLEPMRELEGPVGDLTRSVLTYRHHDTALKLLLEPWRELVRRGDGRARSTIYTLGADTGRMSSVRFNFQQVSREGGLRACITADPGYLLGSADLQGVELCVAGALSGDQTLIEIMADPTRDLHWEVARLAFGPDATKAQRYAIKRGVFGRIYGGGVKAVAAGVGVSIPVAQQIIDAMDALTPQLAEWSRMVRNGIEAGRTQFPTAAGRVIHLPKLAPHAGPNYCIQGTARELLIDALMRWRETRWGDSVLLPVHDELVVMVPEAEAADATAALVQCMTSELAGVPIIAEASEPSFAWADSV